MENRRLFPGELLLFLRLPSPPRGLITRLEQPRQTGLEQGCSKSPHKVTPISIHIMDPSYRPRICQQLRQHRKLGALRELSAAAGDCPALAFGIPAIIGKAALRIHYMFVCWPKLR
jgi:hypothetical protein